MSDKIKVGFIDIGSHAVKAPYLSFTSFPDIELKDIRDLNEDRLRFISDKYD